MDYVDFGSGDSSLSSLLMQAISLLFDKSTASLSLRERGSDQLGSGVLGASSILSMLDRLDEDVQFTVTSV